MPRSVWSGSLSFGLVNIPVKLFSAASQKDVRFHLLHDADGVRIQQKRVCPADGKEVSNDHLVKGYEISPGHYVIVKPEELEALDPKATHTIDIEDFVALKQIDPIYFEHPYYLIPDNRADKAYSLLFTAMEKSGQAAIARMVMRGKQYLTVVRPAQKVLALVTLLFHDEIVPPETLKELPTQSAPINSRELAMAEQLIATLTTDFKPEKYHDEYRERLLQLIERKAEGQEIMAQPKPKETAKVINLMEALEASLAATKEKAAAKKDRPNRKRKA
jgi:DNA end-binding protein Ku